MKKGNPIAIVFPEEGLPFVTSANAILAKAPHPNAAKGPDYVSVANGLTLAELDRVGGPALLSLAVRFGETRLIDNEVLADE